MHLLTRSSWLPIAVALLLLRVPAVSAEVAIDWVTLGDPGNSCETQSQGCFGSVEESYRISKFPMTNTQYAEFLNAVAAADTNGLYDTNMGSGRGGITRAGSSGSYSYATITGRANMPVIFVSFWDTTRFANWLHNGQPTGAQDSDTTEDGAYTLTPADIANNTVTRNGGATVFVPSEDEWYKAAYYDTGAMVYFDYPAALDGATACAMPGPTPNTANCQFAADSDLSSVGGYTGASSPGGTLDQGGNVWEWNEAFTGAVRGLRGGSFAGGNLFLAASFRRLNFPASSGDVTVGFRVASSVPVPAVPSMSPFGMAILSSLLGLAGCRKLRVRSLRRVRRDRRD